MKKKLDDYLALTLKQLHKKEWSSRHQNKYFACPSCGARFYEHHQGCKLELAVLRKEKLVSYHRSKEKASMREWPSNRDVETHTFNDSEIESITDFNYYARAALIVKDITKDEYLIIERVRVAAINEMKVMSPLAKQYLRETLEDA